MNANDPPEGNLVPNHLEKTRVVESDPGSGTPWHAGGVQCQLVTPPAIPDHELLRVIGHGAYGEVWLARNIMGAYRAVKIVFRDTFESDRPYEREFSGIQSFEPISRSHESQVDILHVGRNETERYFYYVMELADDVQTGRQIAPDSYKPKTIHSELKRRGRFAYAETLEICLALTTAVEHLHKHGLIHRDIKPANVIFLNGLPKLADIGLVTETGGTISFVGTEGYLPPEGPGTVQADIYSLGKTLYEVATGKDRMEFPELPTLTGSPAEEGGLFELNEVLLKACHPDKQGRYRDAGEMRADLVLLQAGKSIRRSRALEQRLALITKIAASVLLVAALAAAAYVYQRQQTREERANSLRLQHDLAQQYLCKGHTLCDAGEIVRGLHWFARAWTESPDSSTALRTVIQANLTAWSQGLNTPLATLEDDSIITAAAYSPDGRIVTANVYGTARIWSADGEPLAKLIGHEAGIYLINFSPDGKLLLTGSVDNTARLWSMETAELFAPPLKHAGWVTDAAFSPDGKRLITVSSDSTAQMWSVETGGRIGSSLRHTGGVSAIAVTADGTRAVTGGADKLARVWSLTGHTPVALVTMTHEEAVSGVAFSRDGKVVITRTDQGIYFWSAETGQPDGSPIRHGSVVSAWALSCDGKLLVTGGNDKTARLWSVESRRWLGVAMVHGDVVGAAAFSPDGNLILTGSKDKTARIWSAQTGVPLSLPMLHFEPVGLVAFSLDSRRVLIRSYSERAVVWSLPTLAVEKDIPLEGGKIVAFAFSPDGTRLAVGEGGQQPAVRLLSATTGKKIGAAMPHGNRIWAVAFSPDGKLLLTGSRDKTARLWSVETGEPLDVELRHESQVRAVAFHPSGKIVATGSFDKTARIWNVNTGETIGAPLAHPNLVEDVVFSPDGEALLTACSDGGARLWSIKTGKLTHPPMRHRGAVLSAAFTPDGKRMVTGGRDRVVRFWETETGRPAGIVLDHGEWAEDLCFAAGGRQLWTMGTKTVFLWDAETGERIGPAVWRMREDSREWGYEDFHVSPDGTRIAVQPGILIQMSNSDPPRSVERPELWVQALTWTEMDDHGVLTWLDSATYRARSDQFRSPAPTAGQVHNVR